MNFEKYLWDSDMLADIIKLVSKDNKKLISQNKLQKLHINFNRFLKYSYYIKKNSYL